MMEQKYKTFHPFPQLPKELQNMIWEFAVPVPKNKRSQADRRVIQVDAGWTQGPNVEPSIRAWLKLGRGKADRKSFLNFQSSFKVLLRVMMS